MPARSVSLATRLLMPGASVTLGMLQDPSACTTALPIAVLALLSYSVTVEPGAVASALTIPVMVWVAALVAPPALVIAIVGAAVASVKTTGALGLSAAGSCATMLCVPVPERVTFVLQTPPEPTVVLPIGVVTPL